MHVNESLIIELEAASVEKQSNLKDNNMAVLFSCIACTRCVMPVLRYPWCVLWTS